MARCRCADDPCSCVLRAGAGISISGNGAPTDPWLITAPSRSTGTLNVADDPTLDLTLTGDGTTMDPFVISGKVAIATTIDFADGADVTFAATGAGTQADPLVVTADVPCLDCAAGGNVGEVLTLGADGVFRPGPPSQVPPGAITTGQGLTGAGTVADPLRVVQVCTYEALRKLFCSTSP